MKMEKENPWEKIPLEDYENHMKLEQVLQLQTLNQMMKEQFVSYPVETAMVLGIAGGNGLEHVNTTNYTKVYGVDINEAYLKECGKRFQDKEEVMEYCCIDLMDPDAVLPHAQLVIADLLIEYIGYECFAENMKKIAPDYVSCIIQINTGESFVSDSPYLHVFDDLDEVHHQMQEKELTDTMRACGYECIKVKEEPLPNGKKLVCLDYKN